MFLSSSQISQFNASVPIFTFALHPNHISPSSPTSCVILLQPPPTHTLSHGPFKSLLRSPRVPPTSS